MSGLIINRTCSNLLCLRRVIGESTRTNKVIRTIATTRAQSIGYGQSGISRNGKYISTAPHSNARRGSPDDATSKTASRAQSFASIEAREIEPEKDQFGMTGEEITGTKLNKQALAKILSDFYVSEPIRELAKTHNMDETIFSRAFLSFRRYCYKSLSLPPELYVTFCDISRGHGHESNLFPFFLSHAREAFPHLECQEELRRISDFGLPHQWYPEARAKNRKIIFHCGPTNSGKTHGAMKRFLESKSGVYCGPLKLLAVEIFDKANANKTVCDLVTGEERRPGDPESDSPAPHVSCTVEMAATNKEFEVAVIDEIQMLRDPSRGWAWTRALMGIAADEVHLCGEEAALDIIQAILISTLDTLEVIRYDRLTPLEIEEKPLGSLTNVRKGDCIVTFGKTSLYTISLQLEQLGYKVAVVYGSMSPLSKVEQCRKFNEGQCDVMVATDAIGMGLNLSIGRVIFSTMTKMTNLSDGRMVKEYLTPSACKQIAGRAGRFKSSFPTGYTTTLKNTDLKTLRKLMSSRVEPIERAGLHPTAEQIELFAYHLPHLSLRNLIDLFMDLCKYDTDSYFMCEMESFKVLADAIQHVNMDLRKRYVFCLAPVNVKEAYMIRIFTSYARHYGNGEIISRRLVERLVNWPYSMPKTIADMHQLEIVHDSLELYQWLAQRMPDIFADVEGVRALQLELEEVISGAMTNFIKLITTGDVPDSSSPKTRKIKQ